MPEGDPPPVFTLEAVNALLPRLRALMEQQMGRRTEIEQRLDKLAKLLGTTPSHIEVDASDTPPVRDLKQDLATHVSRYQSAWGELEEMGAVLKDPRAGLVDFYGQVDGKRVWLCWKYGEEAVTHYHGLHEGFSGRKAIEPAMRHRHLN
ncbi:MAG TPA: DUF2203 domain-containing protein [Polyangiaceae bacterium]|jgi:hypothetical protein